MVEVSISQAKAGFSEYVNRAAYGQERIVILSRGKPKAVMLNLDDLRRLEEMGDALAATQAIEVYAAGAMIPWEQVKAELAGDVQAYTKLGGEDWDAEIRRVGRPGGRTEIRGEKRRGFICIASIFETHVQDYLSFLFFSSLCVSPLLCVSSRPPKFLDAPQTNDKCHRYSR